MKIMPVDLNLNGCKIDFSSFEIFGKVAQNNHEVVFMILDENSEIYISGIEKSLVLKSQDLKEFDSFKFNKNGSITEFIFITPETADKTWLFNNKSSYRC